MSTDTDPTEGAQGNGAGGANQSTSQPGGQPPSADTAKLLESLRKLEGEVNALKSEKDRGIAKVAKRLDDFTPVLEQIRELTGKGMSIDEAAREIEYRQIREKVLGANPQVSTNVSPSGGSGSPDVAADVVKGAVDEFGLTLEDSDVAAIIGKGLPTTKTLAELAKLSVERQNQPKPNPAAIAAPVTGQTPTPNLKASYEKERDEMVKNTRPGDERIKKFTALKEKYRKQGLAIY